MLEAVEIQNFRCIQHARLDFDSRATVICGDNASGKTSLLEAIFFLSHGRSFRTGTREHVVARHAEFMRIVGWCRSQGGQATLGVEWSDGTTRLRLAGRPVRSASQLAQVLPLQVIDPGVHRVIEEGSARRRRLLDWGVFHVKHEFMAAWRRYHRALDQRNAALRAGGSIHEAGVWEDELSSAGSAVDLARASYVDALMPHFMTLIAELSNQSIDMKYYRGWSDEESLADALRAGREKDARLRFTTVGPHRADLRFTYAGQPARDRVSRGEQKMLAVALILAQIRCLSEVTRIQTCLLLDDPAAELDVDNLGKLLRIIDQLPGQLIVTAVNKLTLQGFTFGRTFHVKQGQFHAVL